jgi:hypothetical protein
MPPLLHSSRYAPFLFTDLIMEDTKNVVISLRERLFVWRLLATGTSDHKAKARDSNIHNGSMGFNFKLKFNQPFSLVQPQHRLTFGTFNMMKRTNTDRVH